VAHLGREVGIGGAVGGGTVAAFADARLAGRVVVVNVAPVVGVLAGRVVGDLNEFVEFALYGARVNREEDGGDGSGVNREDDSDTSSLKLSYHRSGKGGGGDSSFDHGRGGSVGVRSSDGRNDSHSGVALNQTAAAGGNEKADASNVDAKCVRKRLRVRLEAALNVSNGQANDFDFEADDLWDDRGFGGRLNFVRIVDLALLVAVQVARGAEHTRAAVLHVMAEKLAGIGRPAPSLALRDIAVVIARVLRMKAGAVVAAAVLTFGMELETSASFWCRTSAGGGGHNCCEEEDLEHGTELQFAK